MAASKRIEKDQSGGANWLLLFLLILGYAVYNLDKNVIAILIEPLKAEFAMSDGQVGILTGIASTAPFALACIPVGMLADRVNRKRLLIVLMVGWSLMTGLAGLATVVAVLYVSRIGIGAFEGGFTPVSLSLLADSFHRDRRATAMGIFGLGAPVGVFLGLGLGGVIAEEYGWRIAFFLAGIPGLIIAVLLAFLIVEPKRGRFDPPAKDCTDPSFIAVASNIWRDRVLLHIIIGMLLCAVLQAALAIWTPSFLIRGHGLELTEAGLLAAVIVGVFGAAGAAISGFIADALGKQREWRRHLAPIIGLPIAVLAMLLAVLWAPSLYLAAPLLAMGAFFGQWYSGVGYGVVSNLAPPSMRGATLSILLVAFNLGSVGLGSSVVGFVSDAYADSAGTRSIGIGLAAAAILGLWGSIHIIISMRSYRDRLAKGVG